MTTAPLIDHSSLQTLRAQVRGQVFAPEDAGYRATCLTWDAATFVQHPAIVVLPETADDVRRAMAFAHAHALPVGVQGGGHSPVAANDALLLNCSRMQAIAINPEAATARVEAGVLAHELLTAAHAHGLAASSGFAGTVGVIGYLLGGGLGWLARQHGFSAASVRMFELVTATGEVLRVDAHTHPDLFWGLRGGGGNFGVVTAVELGLYPIESVFGGQVAYAIDHARAVLSHYARWTQTVPDQLTSAVRITHYPDVPLIPAAVRGKSTIAILGCYNGPQVEGETWFRAMRELAPPIFDTFAQLPFPQVANITNEPAQGPPIPLYSGASTMHDLDSDAIDAVLDSAGTPASGIYSVELRQLGGALNRGADSTMAASAVGVGFAAQAFAIALTPQIFAIGSQTIQQLMGTLKPADAVQTLYNMLRYNDMGEDRTRVAFTPETYQRLVALKRTYDPHNTFRFNNNIPPTL